MEGHRCKLCLKPFINGRALGGHMRSHVFSLPTPLLPQPAQQDTDSAPSSSSSEEGEEGDEGITTNYELRENPKTNIRLVDQEFSVVLQDRESETESSKNPARRKRRSRRIKPRHRGQEQRDEKARKFLKLDTISNNQPSKTTESWTDQAEQAASSISNATTEEDVAFCLMLLSKDRWANKQTEEEEEEEEEKYAVDETEDDDSSEEEELKESKNRGQYKCETCNKMFKSYQALGGHRASHKKIRVDSPKLDPVSTPPDKKIHQCPVCYRVFPSGQALGGHKRSHVMAGAVGSSAKLGDKRISSSFIDLNLPAPPEDQELEDFSQMEVSAVSDAEFVNQTRRRR